jgi:hypothetical protein
VTQENGTDCLHVNLLIQGGPTEQLFSSTRQALENIPPIQKAIAGGTLKIAPLAVTTENSWQSSGSIKRTIHDNREITVC